MAFLIVFALVLITAVAWMYLFWGPRRLPSPYFLELAALNARSYSPIRRLARLALRDAWLESHGHLHYDAIDAALARLKLAAMAEPAADENAEDADAIWNAVRDEAREQAYAEPPPSVAICMAARDEAHNLPATLTGLAGQAWWPLQIVVVDDHSTDRTRELLDEAADRMPGLSVLAGRDLPEGWSGKNWALHQAVCHLRGVVPSAKSVDADAELAGAAESPDVPLPEWLLFVDADVTLDPDAVFGAVATARKMELDALSVFPSQQCETFSEKLMVPYLLHMLSLLFPARADVPRPEGQYMACGMFLLVRRTAYEAVGGHAAIAGVHVEDMALGTRLHQAGYRISWWFSRVLAKTRMYRGLIDVWRGLRKNAYEGMGARPEKLIVGVLVALLLALTPFVGFLSPGLLVDANGLTNYDWLDLTLEGTLVVFSLLGMLFSAASLGRILLCCGVRPLWFWSFTLPISTMMYAAIGIASAIQHHTRGGPQWKGRTYHHATTPGQAGSKTE